MELERKPMKTPQWEFHLIILETGKSPMWNDFIFKKNGVVYSMNIITPIGEINHTNDLIVKSMKIK